MAISQEKALPLLELWYTALRAEIGIRIRTNDAHRMKTALYQARKQSGDEALSKLMIQTPPLNPTGEVWITQRYIDLPEGLEDAEG